MSTQAAIDIATQAITSFLPDIHGLAINAFDKVGFDLDTTGRKRQTQWIEETFRSAFWNNGYGQVNIAIWNMHLNEEHYFSDPILVTGLVPMGNGGGFRVVVFKGDGWLKNNGDRGFENWCCSGNQSQDGNVISFRPI
jgi:hypothetical protein